MHISPDKQHALEQRLARLGVRHDDLIERFVWASGPGGQKVNKTSSAVYLKHLPSGIEVKAQQARSQTLNRYHARRMLAERLEAQQLGTDAPAARRLAKVQKQKRRRHKRAKQKAQALSPDGNNADDP